MTMAHRTLLPTDPKGNCVVFDENKMSEPTGCETESDLRYPDDFGDAVDSLAEKLRKWQGLNSMVLPYLARI